MDTSQVKFRMPERIRRQVLAAAKKSGRPLSAELNHLIELGLSNPGDPSLITKVAEVAAAEAAEKATSRMAQTGLVEIEREFEALTARIMRRRARELSALFTEEPEPATPMPPVDPNDDWWRHEDETK
jgi:hypothetical protein